MRIIGITNSFVGGKFTEIIKDVHWQLDRNHRMEGDLTKISTYENLLKRRGYYSLTVKKGNKGKITFNGLTNLGQSVSHPLMATF